MSLKRELRKLFRSFVCEFVRDYSIVFKAGDTLRIRLPVHLATVDRDGIQRDTQRVVKVAKLVCTDVSQIEQMLLRHGTTFAACCCGSCSCNILYVLVVKFADLQDEVNALFCELGDHLFADGIEIPETADPKVRILLLQRAVLQKALECMSSKMAG